MTFVLIHLAIGAFQSFPSHNNIGRGRGSFAVHKICPSTKTMSRKLFSLLLVALSFFIRHCSAQVTVEVRDIQGPEDYTVLESYTFPEGFTNPLDWYVTPYASLPSGELTGILYQPIPQTACSTLETVSFCDSTKFPNVSWVGETNLTMWALVDGYHTCIKDKLKNVQEGGFDGLITFSYNDSDTDVSNRVRDEHSGIHIDVQATEFPIIVVSERFANILRKFTLTTINNTDCPTMVLNVRSDPTRQMWIGFAVSFAMVLVVVGVPVVTCVCLVCCVCCLCIEGRNCGCCGCRESGVYEVNDVHVRVLGDDLVLGGRHYLEEEYETEFDNGQNNELPTIEFGTFRRVFENNLEQPKARKYEAAKEINMSCAICLECFNEEETVHALSCDEHHVFHPYCIEKWLGVHNMCPVCRTYVIQPNF